MAAANSPVNARSGRTDGSRSGNASVAPAPVASASDQAAGHGRGQDDGHRLRRRDGPVAVAADDHEDRLAERPPRGPARSPMASNRIPGCRVELRGDDRDHPGDGQRERDDPRPVERLATRAPRCDRDDHRIGVEAEQRERDRDQVERDEHREVEREPDAAAAAPRLTRALRSRLARRVQPLGAARDAARRRTRWRRAGRSPPRQATKESGLHARVVGEPGQRAEHPEQGRGERGRWRSRRWADRSAGIGRMVGRDAGQPVPARG